MTILTGVQVGEDGHGVGKTKRLRSLPDLTDSALRLDVLHSVIRGGWGDLVGRVSET